MLVSLFAVAAILAIGSAPLLAGNISYSNLGQLAPTRNFTASPADLDYNDDTVVFTNIGSTVPTPEPSSIALLGTGLFGLAGARRRKFAR